MVPNTISRSKGARLHEVSDWDTVTKDEKLKNWLSRNPIPAPKAKACDPRFTRSSAWRTVVIAMIIMRLSSDQ